MDALFEIKLDLAAKGSRDSARSLYAQLKAAILDGRLADGFKLPVTRQSNSIFGVSRNTAAEVYERLASEGFVATRHGSGTYVRWIRCGRAPCRDGRRPPRPKQVQDPRLNAFWLRPDVTAALDFWWDEPPGARRALPPPTGGFPARLDRLAAVSVRCISPGQRQTTAAAGEQAGLLQEPARQSGQLPAARRHHPTYRRDPRGGVPIRGRVGHRGGAAGLRRAGAGAGHAGKTTVAIEDPGYPPMRVAFAAAGAKVVPVEVDEEGLCVERLPERCTRHLRMPFASVSAGHVHVAPPAQGADRIRARRMAPSIIEDDYDGEFRYDGSPLEALRSSGAEDVVFYVGTFSKCMLPALRFGFIVAPEWAMRTLIAAKNSLDWHCPTPLQMGVARFIAEGHLKRHVQQIARHCIKAAALLLEILREDFAAGTDTHPVVLRHAHRRNGRANLGSSMP